MLSCARFGEMVIPAKLCAARMAASAVSAMATFAPAPAFFMIACAIWWWVL